MVSLPLSIRLYECQLDQKVEKRPADAIMVARIATGEIEDKMTGDGKNAAAVALGRIGRKSAGYGHVRPET